MGNKVFALILVIAMCLLTLSGTPADAKCPMVKYMVKGRVLESQTSAPIKNAEVFVFYDENEYFHPAGFGSIFHTFQTDESGRFEVTAYYPSQERRFLFFQMECDEQPKKIEIIVEKDDHIAREIFPIEKVLIEKEHETSIFKIPDLLLLWNVAVEQELIESAKERLREGGYTNLEDYDIRVNKIESPIRSSLAMLKDANYVVIFSRKLLPNERPSTGGGYEVFFKRENNENKLIVVVLSQ